MNIYIYIYIIASLMLAAILGLYYYFFKDLNYFKKHGILYKLPLPILGNMGPAIFCLKSTAELVKEFYNLHSKAKYIGIFDIWTTPVIMVRDPELIKSIMIKQFDTFPHRLNPIDKMQDPIFSKNIFSSRGERWRQLRSLMTSALTPSKMKSMFKLMSEYGADFSTFLAQLPPEQRMMQMKDIISRYTNDVIAVFALGINIDSRKNSKNEFYVYGKEAAAYNDVVFIKFWIFSFLPWLARLINLRLIHKKIADTFRDIVENIIRARDENGIVRPDVLQLLMKNRSKDGKVKLTIEDIVSLAFFFFIDGFDANSTLICFAAHEIAANQDIQEKLQNEIDQTLKENNGQVHYETINAMEYLDAVICEALRMYPALAAIDRVCVKDFELPSALPGKKPFTIKKGCGVWIPVYGLHFDAMYFEEPEKFDPERFLGEKKKNILNCGAYLPFGLGSRMCIGNRFALLETKILLFHLLSRCNLKICEKTSIPIKFVKGGLSIKPEGDLWLNVEPRKNNN